MSLVIAFVLATGAAMVFGELVPKNLAIATLLLGCLVRHPAADGQQAAQAADRLPQRVGQLDRPKAGIEPREELAGGSVDGRAGADDPIVR